jgi:hypothetical protein
VRISRGDLGSRAGVRPDDPDTVATVGVEERRRRVDRVASLYAAGAALALAIAIYLGSRELTDFDEALIGYAVATVFLAFGVVYRYVVWVREPPARAYLRRGVQAFLSWQNFLKTPLLVPRALVSHLSFQTFIARRGRGRWLAHQAIFWGVVSATLITFPLTFGWITFGSTSPVGETYIIRIWGLDTVSFDTMNVLGWLVFHFLDISAILTIAGCTYFLWRRFQDREATTGQRLGYDFVPLIALVAISVTGLQLTMSSALLDGRGYEFIAVLHMACVVLTLVFIPFGKFFHVIQRPASIGVEVYKNAAIEHEGVAHCRRCDQPLEATTFVHDLQDTMGRLGLDFEAWIETCPRCKRLARGEVYLEDVKAGYR